MLEQWISHQELRRSLTHSSFKLEHDFEWGLEHLGLAATSTSPAELIKAYTESALAKSQEHFVPPPLPLESYELRGHDLRFPSTIKTFDPVNNVARCRFFPHRQSKAVILAIPHWNSGGPNYDRLCQFLNSLGYSAIWLSLPFHDDRGGEESLRYTHGKSSTLMVSANIGLTLQSMRQAVQDAISTVSWLKHNGYERIALLGASIGSCAAFLAAAHDPRIEGLFANLMSSYFGEVVWAGISTRHVRKSVERHLDLEGLRSMWLLNSPIAFIPALKRFNPRLKQFIVSGRFDSTFPFYLTQTMIAALEAQGVSFEHRVLPCGHYTLGAYWFRYVDGFYLWRFFRRLFSNMKY